MKAEVHLRTNAPHSVILTAENDAEGQLLKIFDDAYHVAISMIRHDYSYRHDGDIQGVQIDLVKKKDSEGPTP